MKRATVVHVLISVLTVYVGSPYKHGGVLALLAFVLLAYLGFFLEKKPAILATLESFLFTYSCDLHKIMEEWWESYRSMGKKLRRCWLDC